MALYTVVLNHLRFRQIGAVDKEYTVVLVPTLTDAEGTPSKQLQPKEWVLAHCKRHHPAALPAGGVPLASIENPKGELRLGLAAIAVHDDVRQVGAAIENGTTWAADLLGLIPFVTEPARYFLLALKFLAKRLREVPNQPFAGMSATFSGGPGDFGVGEHETGIESGEAFFGYSIVRTEVAAHPTAPKHLATEKPAGRAKPLPPAAPALRPRTPAKPQ